MDDYDDTGDYAPDEDEYHTEEEANGHDEDEEDVEQAKIENALYKSDDENEEPSEDEFEEDGILGIEKEQEDNVDNLIAEEKAAAAAKKKEPVSKVVPPEKRKTNPIMTKFEFTNLIAWRAQMIENVNSPLMIPDTKFTNSIDIAREETEKGVNPIIIVRNLPNGSIEEWKCSELSLPKAFK